MLKSASSLLAARLCRGLAGLLLAGLAAAASAAPGWVESNSLFSWLDDNWTYTSDAATRTATVTYHDQTATNTGATAAHLGMYVGWVWSYDGSGAATSLLWSNADQAFVGGGIKLVIGGASGSVRLGDVINDSWIGVPWTPGAPAAAIATEADWVVPLFDFGELAGGASVLYEMSMTLTFDSQAAFDDWNRAGSFYVSSQAVQLPEPDDLALALLALVAAGLALRRRGR